MITLHDPHRKCRKGHERFFGESEYLLWSYELSGDRIFVSDNGTGDYSVWNCSGNRVNRVTQGRAAAAAAWTGRTAFAKTFCKPQQGNQ